MKCFIIATAIAALICVSSAAPGKLGHEGKCPDIPMAKDFSGEKFEGKWFCMKMANPKNASCVTFDIQKRVPHGYTATMLPLNAQIEVEQVKADDISQGYTILSDVNPAWFGGNLKTFAVDYSEYIILKYLVTWYLIQKTLQTTLQSTLFANKKANIIIPTCSCGLALKPPAKIPSRFSTNSLRNTRSIVRNWMTSSIKAVQLLPRYLAMK